MENKLFGDLWVAKCGDYLFFYKKGEWDMRENLSYDFSLKPNLSLKSDPQVLIEWNQLYFRELMELPAPALKTDTDKIYFNNIDKSIIIKHIILDSQDCCYKFKIDIFYFLLRDFKFPMGHKGFIPHFIEMIIEWTVLQDLRIGTLKLILDKHHILIQNDKDYLIQDINELVKVNDKYYSYSDFIDSLILDQLDIEADQSLHKLKSRLEILSHNPNSHDRIYFLDSVDSSYQ